MNHADLDRLKSMTPAERKLDEIAAITTGKELAGWHMGRALEGRAPYPGENAALAAKERELRARGRR